MEKLQLQDDPGYAKVSVGHPDSRKGIGKIEYVATVDLINSYLIDRINRILLEFAVYLVNSLYINYLYSIFNSYSQTVAIAI